MIKPLIDERAALSTALDLMRDSKAYYTRNHSNGSVASEQPGSHHSGGRLRIATTTGTRPGRGSKSVASCRRPKPWQNLLESTPDYDASDELEFGSNWFPWILRGVYPPPGNPPQ